MMLMYFNEGLLKFSFFLEWNYVLPYNNKHYIHLQHPQADPLVTPQEVHRVAAFDNIQQTCDSIEKHSEVHGHLLEPEVIINVKQESQVQLIHKHFSA